MASQIISLKIVYSTVYSGADQRKYQNSASLAFVRGIHRWPVNSPQMASNAENVPIWWRHHGSNNQLLFTASLCGQHLSWEMAWKGNARSKLGLCSVNLRAGYFSNLACDWLSIVRTYSKQETENGPWSGVCFQLTLFSCDFENICTLSYCHR